MASDALTQAEAVLAVFDVTGERSPAHATDRSDEVPDVLLTTVFGEQRAWEIACEMVGDTLDSVRLCTLLHFLS